MKVYVILALTLAIGCKKKHVDPPTWEGLDRGSVSCDGSEWSTEQTCIGHGHVYRCIRESGSSVFRCAEVRGAVAEKAERAE